MDQVPAHLDVFTMDSALLQARKFFEFFTHEPSPKDNYLTVRDFGLTATLKSPLYPEPWRTPINRWLMHLQRYRLTGGTNLNRQVVNFANDILRLWDEFSNDPAMKDYKSRLDNVRKKAIDDAYHNAANFGYLPIFK